MNFKTIAEVHEWLKQEGLTRVSSFLAEAIDQEIRDLCKVNDDTVENNRKDAEVHFLEEINFFLGEGRGREFDPNLIINYRRRPKSWAVATMIEEKANGKIKDK